MKYFLIVTFFTGLYAWAELPNSVSDKKTDDNFTYVDSKANSALQVTKNFTSAKSTVTVSGWIDIGLIIRDTGSSCGTAYPCTATCVSGEKILGGGCEGASAADYLHYSFPNSGNSWTCAWTGVAGAKKSYAICARVK